jgi:hypothetical protein
MATVAPRVRASRGSHRPSRLDSIDCCAAS